ncbi:hypothetical protein [Micromonospora chersina]
MQELQVVVDRFMAGDIGSERLPDLAAEALTEGFDSPALRELAGLSRADVREARELFVHAARELGAAIPDEDACPEDLVLYWASRMVDGSVAPAAGANRIVSHGEALGWPDRLSHLLGLASVWDDWPEGRDETERSMLAEAGALLAERLPTGPHPVLKGSTLDRRH